jgi:DNA-binding response OmpR family regulator
MKILVVDDEPHTGASVTLTLGKAHQVEMVSAGRDAFELLNDNTRGFELLISDHMMPEWSGSELIHRLQLAGWQGKYLVLSAYMSPEIEAIYRKLGVEHILTKPFDVVELRNVVAEIERTSRKNSPAAMPGFRKPWCGPNERSNL